MQNLLWLWKSQRERWQKVNNNLIATNGLHVGDSALT